MPLPHSLESDQLKNAESFAAVGGGWIRQQGTFLRRRPRGVSTHLRYAAEDLETHARLGPPPGPARCRRAAGRPRRVFGERDRNHGSRRSNRARSDIGKDRSMKLPRETGPIHFIGIGGIGMSGIAEVMKTLGYTFKDRTSATTTMSQRLRKLGIPVEIGHRAENLGDARVVVVSSAVKPTIRSSPRRATAPADRPAGRDAGRADAVRNPASRSAARMARPPRPRSSRRCSMPAVSIRR